MTPSPAVDPSLLLTPDDRIVDGDPHFAAVEEDSDTELRSAVRMEKINPLNDFEGDIESESGDATRFTSSPDNSTVWADERLLYPTKYFRALDDLETEVISGSLVPVYDLTLPVSNVLWCGTWVVWLIY